MANPAKDLIQLSALIDGELNGAEASRVRERLAGSETLREEYRRIKTICDLLELWDRLDMRNVAASPAYEAELLQRLRSMNNSKIKPPSIINLSKISRN